VPAGVLALAACGDGQLVAADAWIREAPPGAAAMAGYATLRNGTREALRCDAASGPDFGAVELHRTVVENGMSRMERGQVVELAAGGEARLEPGGLHLMLFRPQRELRAGTRTRLTLQCGSRSVSAEFEVRP
jgi:copper(I)-binding protein